MADMAMGACMWSGVPTHTASRLRFSLASIWRQSWYTRASGNFALSCFSWAESTSATQTSFTLGWRSSWSRVTNAMPPAPKAPSRNWPLGGAEINWRTKNRAAKKVRRSIRYDICGTGLLACRNRPVILPFFGGYEGLAVCPPRAPLYDIPGISARKARNAELGGGPPGPQPMPPSASRSLDEADFVGEESDQGSRADEGVR